MDHPRGRSRGFGFVYFDRAEDAVKAKDYATETAMEIGGHKVRVDYSLTRRAHTPTPGQCTFAIISVKSLIFFRHGSTSSAFAPQSTTAPKL